MHIDNNREGCWLVRGSCRKHGYDAACPRRHRLARARALRSIFGRLRGVPEVTLVMLTTGKPGPEIRERFDALRLGVRTLAQRYAWDAISAIEWTWRKEYGGWHVHAHVVIVGRRFYPHAELSAAAVAAGLGSYVHVSLADFTGPAAALWGALYAVKYVAKGVATPERSRELKGRRLWTGHGKLSAWKGSPGSNLALEEGRAAVAAEQVAREASEKGIYEYASSCEVR